MILSAGWEIVCGWPDSFYEFLDDLTMRRRSQAAGSFGLNRDFGAFFAYLQFHREEPWLTVRKAFQVHLEKNWDGGTVVWRHEVAGWEKGRIARISMAEASRRLERGEAKTKGLILAGLVRAERASLAWGAPIFIQRRDIDKIAPPGKPPLTLAHAAYRLGITIGQARRLLNAGVIQPVLGPNVDGSKTYLFPVREIDRLIRGLDNHASENSVTCKYRRTFGGVLKGQERLKLPLKPIVDAMRDETLRAVNKRCEKRRVDQFEFDLHDVKVLFDQVESCTTQTGGPPLSLVAKRFGISTESVAWLVKRGHLKTSSNSTPQRIRVLSSSVDAFDATWVKSSALARQYATSWGLIRRALRALGLKPIKGAETDRYAVAYFLRAQVDQVDLLESIRKTAVHRGKDTATYKREYRRGKRLAFA
jgi:hypothetical protein